MKNKNLPILAFNSILLAAFSIIILLLHPDRMFQWLDGNYMHFLAIFQHNWMSNLTYGMNPFSGLGDISFPLNTNLIPATWLASLFSNNLTYSVVTYTVLSIQYFISAYLLCRVFKFNLTHSILAAWGITLLLLPLLPTYHGMQIFYAITQISPYLLNFLFFCNLLIYCYAKIGRTQITQTLLISCTTVFILFYLLVANAAGVTIAAPFIVFSFIILTIFSENKFEFVSKISFCITILALTTGLSYFPFFFGLLLYSVPAFFPGTLSTHFTWSDVSILFNFIFPAGRYLVPIALLGLLTSCLIKINPYRKYAISTLIFFFILILLGVSTIYIPDWYHGPNSMYFEYMLWPLYMGYAIVFIQAFINRVFGKVKFSMKIMRYTFPALLTTALLVNFIFKKNEPTVAFPLFPQIPPMIQYLQNKIALKKATAFQGSVATFYPKVTPNQSTNWLPQITFDSLVLLPKLHYSYRATGLWLRSIPTLQVYSPTLSPALFLLVKNTLSRPIDENVRNILTLTKLNIPILQTLGVSYIITNSLERGASLNLVMSENIDHKHGSLYLYKINHSNTASYSPTKLIKLTNVNAFINQANEHKIDFENTVYVTNPITTPLVKTSASKMTPIVDGFKVTASSKGISSLLLPLLYSHCLHLNANDNKSKVLSFQRANLAESLLVFSKHLNVDITYRYGLGKYAHCRQQDIRSLKAVLKY